jgi:hypothetical protein
MAGVCFSASAGWLDRWWSGGFDSRPVSVIMPDVRSTAQTNQMEGNDAFKASFGRPCVLPVGSFFRWYVIPLFGLVVHVYTVGIIYAIAVVCILGCGATVNWI